MKKNSNLANVKEVTYETIRSQLDQICREACNESYDPRRLNLVKSQITLLERQCHNMSLQLNERQSSLQHTYATLEQASNKMERWLDNSSSETVVISKTDFDTILKTIRGAGKRLNKPTESVETVEMRQIYANKFTCTLKSPQDVFSYNIKQMGNLEHKLSELAVSMELFKHSIPEQQPAKTGVLDMSKSLSEFSTSATDYKKSVSTLRKQLDECCLDLTQLSLLQPQQQLNRRKKFDELSLESVLEYLKKFTKKKEVLEVIPLIWQLASHPVKLSTMRATMLDKELQKCHERLELHTVFVLEVLSGLESMFGDFEKHNLEPMISKPLSEMIDAYELLQNEQNNENFAEFFKRFDDLIPSIKSVLTLLKASMKVSDSSGLQNMFREQILAFTKQCLLNRKEMEKKMADHNRKVKEVSSKLQSSISLDSKDSQ